MRTPIAALLLTACLAGRAGAGDEPDLTALHVQGDTLRLVWGAGLDRYIVERFQPGAPDSEAIGTSSGVTDVAVSLPLTADSAGFYRIRAGLQAVRLGDAALDAIVRSHVGPAKVTPTNWLYDLDVRGLTNLSVALRGVSTLDGVAALENLEWFDVGGNRVASLAGLAGAPDLQVLRLDGNELASLAGLGALPALQVLDVSHNRLADLDPLAALPQLEVLYADRNEVASADALAGLLALRVLDLSGNRIASLAPLLANAQQGGLGAGDVVYLSGNPVADPAEVAALRGYGATVVYP
jgi:hypothetical protein